MAKKNKCLWLQSADGDRPQSQEPTIGALVENLPSLDGRGLGGR